LKSLGADYHADNYYPQPTDAAEMRYGAFIQLWAVQSGRGRVAAFTDSTVFSNFCTFEPGKSELMVGMLEWLNHRGGPANPGPWLLIAGGLAIALGLRAARGWPAAWLMLPAAGLLGWTSAALAVQAIHRQAMPPPPVRHPLVTVDIDRAVCDGPLSDAGFIDPLKSNGFGIFERWMLRLGYFTLRRGGGEAFSGDARVFLYPDRPLPGGFREKLVEYVRQGGKLLVVDSPENTESTANKVLEPFGLSLDAKAPASGKLVTRAKWRQVPVASASVVKGGEPLAWLGDKPVGATVAYGRGSVTVVGFGSRFADPNMGGTGDAVPNDELRAVYAVEFSLLREMLGKALLGTFPQGKAAAAK
jgi:hypothetical protein